MARIVAVTTSRARGCSAFAPWLRWIWNLSDRASLFQAAVKSFLSCSESRKSKTAVATPHVVTSEDGWVLDVDPRWKIQEIFLQCQPHHPAPASTALLSIPSSSYSIFVNEYFCSSNLVSRHWGCLLVLIRCRLSLPRSFSLEAISQTTLIRAASNILGHKLIIDRRTLTSWSILPASLPWIKH